MAEYVQLDGIRTWYDQRGSGDPLVLLHPGGVGVDSRALAPTRDGLVAHFHVFLPERRGHGHTPDTDGPYSYELAAEDTIRFLEQVIGKPVRLAGVSDGAVVALLVATTRPDLVTRLVCIAGVFHHTGWVPSALDHTSEPPAFLVDSYADVSPDGRDHFRVVHHKLEAMHAQGPALMAAGLRGVKCRTLVMVGDDDEVTLEHAVAFYRGLGDGELAVVPGTSHGLLVEKPDLCNRIILAFLTTDAVPTFAVNTG